MSGAAQNSRLSGLDRWGMIISGACVVHCLALPLMVALLPVMATFLPAEEWVHPVLLGLALPISGAALLRGYRVHRLVWPALVGAVGLALIAGAMLVEGAAGETVLSVLGALCLLHAHLRNWKAHIRFSRIE